MIRETDNKIIEIRVINDAPPVPTVRYDWAAFSVNYEPGYRIGYGRTRQEAIDSYLDAIEAPLDTPYVVVEDV
jgi:hypothetical protein